MIRWLEHDWRAKRAKLRENHITEKTGINTGDWFSKLPEGIRAYYEAGGYYHAFTEASKRYLNAVRTKAVITAGDERADMQKVFPAPNPMLCNGGFCKTRWNCFYI
jgi:hypothetical protein